jgi:hypothetical protein
MRERLRQTHQRVINGQVAVRVILAHHIADDAGAFARRPVRLQAHLLHPIKDAPMHRLQPVADIGKRAPHDYAHRVSEVRTAHFVFDIGGNYVLIAAIGAGRTGERKLALGWLFLICHVGLSTSIARF